MTDGQIQRIDGVDMHFHREGTGTPVVLVNSMLGATQSRVATALSARVCAISVDLPGTGLSEKPPTLDCSLQAQGERLSKFVGAMCTEPTVLVASSTTGQIALQAALISEQAIKLVVLLSPVLDVNVPIARKCLDHRFRKRLLELVLSSRRLLGFTMRKLSSDTPAAHDAAEFLHMIGRTEGFVACLDNTIDMLLNRMPLPIGDIQVPIRVVLGGRDALASVLGNKQLLHHNENVSATIFPQCGHLIELQEPEKVSNLITSFIEELGPTDS